VCKVMKLSVECAEDESILLCVIQGVWWSEGSECLFCVWYKMCGGLRGQSACFQNLSSTLIPLCNKSTKPNRSPYRPSHPETLPPNLCHFHTKQFSRLTCNFYLRRAVHYISTRGMTQ